MRAGGRGAGRAHEAGGGGGGALRGESRAAHEEGLVDALRRRLGLRGQRHGRTQGRPPPRCGGSFPRTGSVGLTVLAICLSCSSAFRSVAAPTLARSAASCGARACRF